MMSRLIAVAALSIVGLAAQAKAAPLVHGHYSTGGRGSMTVHQLGEKITLVWRGPNGTSVFDGTWQNVRFRDEGVTRPAFYGAWTLKDASGRMIRWGEGAVLVEPAMPDLILVRTWEHKNGSWRPSQTGTFRLLTPLPLVDLSRIA